uniref:HAT C-terminal dimerisation domain-containing protein n=1 Tax=Latimeria chalumnae TaxID=7897 RepID=H3ANW4_LATCH
PDIWNQKQWEEFKEKYPWLDFKDRKLDCCNLSNKVANATRVFKEQGISLPNEWCNYCVEASGNESRNIKLASLRIKIKEHVDSKAHSIAHKFQDQRKANVLGKTIEAISGVVDQASKAVFRTAYYLAKNNLPFSDHENLIELQELNGVNMGKIWHSRYSATGITNRIAKEMQKNMVKLVSSSSKLAVLIAKSTTLSRKATLIVYLKASVEGESPIFMFLDLVELEDQRAKGIVSALLECLLNTGFTDSYLQENWVSFVSDGANVMLGRNSGVATRFCSEHPQLFTWHCMNHRFKLAVADAIDEITTVNHFKVFMEELHNIYSHSNKNERELNEASAEVGPQILHIRQILDVCWVASSFRTVRAVWVSFGALYKHFENASSDTLRNDKERQTYKGLEACLASPEFLCDLVLMYDVLYKLANLSQELQAHSMTFPRAEHLVKRTIRVLASFKDSPGTNAKDLGEFKSITLKPNPKLNCINVGQLLQSLVNNMEKPLSNGDNILADFSILDSSSWPSNPSIRHGEEQVKRWYQAINGIRDYVENPNSEPEDLEPLMICIQTFPCSTAVCERGFSLMNNIATDKRTVLSVSCIASLMLINVNGPPTALFEPKKYLGSWLQNHHSANDTRSRQCKAHTSDPSGDDKKALWHLL